MNDDGLLQPLLCCGASPTNLPEHLRPLCHHPRCHRHIYSAPGLSITSPDRIHAPRGYQDRIKRTGLSCSQANLRPAGMDHPYLRRIQGDSRCQGARIILQNQSGQRQSGSKGTPGPLFVKLTEANLTSERRRRIWKPSMEKIDGGQRQLETIT